jgi:hypothetical protein
MLGPSFLTLATIHVQPTTTCAGRPLRAWQAANLAIYDHTIAALQALGWHRGP